MTGKQGSIEIAVGTERIVAIGQSMQASAAIDAGLAGWHAGMQMPYAGWASAVAPGCVVRSNGEPLKLHGERLDAGWVGGVELARGVSTVSTTFTEAAQRTVVIVLDDPTAFGDPADGRQLVMGLDGAERAQDAAGNDRPPVLLAMENRSVLAYDIVADRSKPVVVTVASEAGWSLVGVMGSAQLDATGAVAAISSRGLDAVIRPFAAAPTKDVQASQLAWLGPVRTPVERHQARVLASGRPLAAGKSSKPTRHRKGAHQ